MNVAEAKHRIGDIWNLGTLLGWPLSGGTSDFAFWRGNCNTPALSITEDGRGWFDHATKEGGDMVEILAKAEGIAEGAACRRLIEIAEGVTEAPPPVAYEPRATREEKRARWPYFISHANSGDHHVHHDEICTIATSRRFPHFSGVAAAYARGLLVFTSHYDEGQAWPVAAWGITDASRNAAQVRKMDGKVWCRRGGVTFKSKSLPGSLGGWPIGIAEVGDRTNIILTEGEPDLLAALTLQCLISRDPVTLLPRDPGTFGFCCMTGSAKEISESALPMFRGKRVVMVPHVDGPGAGASDSWGTQLQSAGATVEVFDLTGLKNAEGVQAKDLNEAAADGAFVGHRQSIFATAQGEFADQQSELAKLFEL